MSDKIEHIKDSDFQQKVIGSDLPVLVDFWAPWCGPCRALTPLLEQLADDYAGKVRIAKVNVDENQAISTDLGIRSIPTVILFAGGEIKETIVGLRTKEQYAQLIEKHSPV